MAPGTHNMHKTFNEMEETLNAVKIPFVGTEPTVAHEGDAGNDLRAKLDQPLTIEPGQIVMVDLDLRCAIPEGHVGLEFPRSGLGTKGITLANAVGVIDSGYRGPIKAGIVNLSKEPYTINDGDRVCQLVVVAYRAVEWVRTEVLPDSDRGTDGYGSTGVM